MNRMTSDNTFEMNMTQRALNQVYIGKDGWAQYVEQPDQEYSVCDLIRSAAETLGVELPMLNDSDLSGLLADWLHYGAEEQEGVLAILYRALWAMAEVRGKLSRYEATGLEPEEVEEHEAAYIEIMTRTYGPLHQKIGQWMQAEKDGRLVVLPCKKGDTLWSFYNYPASGICKITVTAVSTLDGITVINTHNYGVLPAKDIGDTIFLTREEAEAALKKREEADNEAD